MSHTNNDILSVTNELSKVNLSTDNLEEHSVKEDKVLSNRLSSNSKTESNDDSNEFVEANSSFPEDVTKHNDVDTLTFKDAKEKLDDYEEEDSDINYKSNVSQNSDSQTGLLEETHQKSIVTDESTFIKQEITSLDSNAVVEKQLNEINSETVKENIDDKIKCSNLIKTKSKQSLNNDSFTNSESDENKSNCSNKQTDSENIVEEDKSTEYENPAQSEVLDDDEIKTNPAYIPKTGRFYMHDLRYSGSSGGVVKDNKSGTDTETGENNINSTAVGVNTSRIKISRADRKWEHDLFDYKQQLPKTNKEIIRRYKSNIRLDVDSNCNLKPATINDVDSGEVVEDDDDGNSSPERRHRTHQRTRRQTSYQRRQPKNLVESDKRLPQKIQNKVNRRNVPTSNEQRRRRPQPSNISQNSYQSSGESESKETVNQVIKLENKRTQVLPNRNGFKRTILPTRFHSSSNQVAPRRPFIVCNDNNNPINSKQNHEQSFEPHQRPQRYSTSRQNNIHQEKISPRNSLPMTRQSFNHDLNRESVNTYNGGQRQNQQKFYTNKNEHDTFRRNNLNSNFKQNLQQQQRSSYHQNYSSQTNSHLNNKNSRNFQQNSSGQYFQPNQCYNQQIPSRSSYAQQSYSNIGYSNNFPPLGDSLNQQQDQHQIHNINRNSFNRQQQHHLNEQHSQLRQPTDVVYFDPNQQAGRNSSIIQTRECRRLKIAPPTQ